MIKGIKSDCACVCLLFIDFTPCLLRSVLELVNHDTPKNQYWTLLTV
ncbi:hypothetical protein PAECIP111892_03130 [Paenibacillus auburnensis]|uniref:Uncharacterized protein n=1 Tax=Paenibacillus auburnensis TaxID=2905649 RepID=A0ABM9CDB4_9BACL|nr:hypothetical protein PAECIP111892_03130 [Paenibacillus auburnensis]